MASKKEPQNQQSRTERTNTTPRPSAGPHSSSMTSNASKGNGNQDRGAVGIDAPSFCARPDAHGVLLLGGETARPPRCAARSGKLDAGAGGLPPHFRINPIPATRNKSNNTYIA